MDFFALKTVFERNLKSYCSLPDVSTLGSSVFFKGDPCEEDVPIYTLTKPLIALSIDMMQTGIW